MSALLVLEKFIAGDDGWPVETWPITVSDAGHDLLLKLASRNNVLLRSDRPRFRSRVHVSSGEVDEVPNVEFCEAADDNECFVSNGMFWRYDVSKQLSNFDA